MATTFTTVTDWMAVAIVPAFIDGGNNPPGAPYETPAGYTWKRQEYRIVRERIGQGLTSFGPLTGTSVAGTTLDMRNGADTIAPTAGYQYECIGDEVQPDPQSSGIWRQTQEWLYRGAWTETEA